MKVITLEEYAMGRDEEYKDEWALAEPNAIVLLDRVNGFLQELNFPFDLKVSSGFRPSVINAALAHAAKHSLHIDGKAIDLSDHRGQFKDLFNPRRDIEAANLLRKYGLFMEHPAYTPGWVHLDIGSRPDRPTRVFRPL